MQPVPSLYQLLNSFPPTPTIMIISLVPGLGVFVQFLV